MTKKYFLLAAAASALLLSCNKKPQPTGPITPDDIKTHIAVLANDSLLGRKPFTPGETKTISYISREFKQIGLEPGNNGSYFQDVPMVEIKGTPSETIDISGKASMSFYNTTDFVAFTRQEQ